MGVETAADSLMTRAPDLRDPVALLERRILLISKVAAPAFNCTSRYRYTNSESLQNFVCGRNPCAMLGFRPRFFRIFADAHAERREQL
jgi:hypothetical protein